MITLAYLPTIQQTLLPWGVNKKNNQTKIYILYIEEIFFIGFIPIKLSCFNNSLQSFMKTRNIKHIDVH